MSPRPTIRANRLKTAMGQGRVAPGIHLGFSAPAIIERLAVLGFELLYLDGEHGDFSLGDIAACCRAAELHDLTVLARVPEIDANLISQYLNAGVQGIIVPHVETRPQAEACVDACFMEPMGHRPNGGSRSNRYWHGIDDLAAAMGEVNANVTLTIQLESKRSIDNLDDIMAVRGIDYYTIGKNDLAQSLGLPRLRGRFPEALDRIVGDAEAKIRSAGGRMKDDVMRLGRVNDFLMEGGRRFLAEGRS
jgi:2-keto-3-deoxy-L-rhamnonate aldolase RhmA